MEAVRPKSKGKSKKQKAKSRSRDKNAAVSTVPNISTPTEGASVSVLSNPIPSELEPESNSKLDVEEVPPMIDNKPLVVKETGSEVVEQEKPVLQVEQEQVEQVQLVPELTPVINNEQVDDDLNIVTESTTDLKIEQSVTEKDVANFESENHSFMTACKQVSETPVLVETTLQSSVAMETSQTVAMETINPTAPVVSIDNMTEAIETRTVIDITEEETAQVVAMEPMYPTLSLSLTTQHQLQEEEEDDREERMDDLIPFSEDELTLLYPNRQLDSRAVTEEAFIKASRQDGHPLYELLSLYRKARQALVTVQAHLQAIKNDYNTYKSLLWKLESHTITSSAKCGDRVKVSYNHTYKEAIFDPESAVLFNAALSQTRDLLKEELCMKSYSAQLARIHVEHYLSQLLNSLPFLSQLHQDVGFTSWIPQAPPGCLDQHSSNIRDAISVLFMFQRRPLKDKEFSQYCRKWLNTLMSVLLRVATLCDHQFIQHHLLRCPPGVSEWAGPYLQVMSPLATVQVLEAQFGQRDILSGSIPDQNCAYDWGVGMGLHQDWGGPLLDHFVCSLATLLLPIKQREEFLVALSVPIATGEERDGRHKWTFVEEDLEEEEEGNLLLLKESDYICFFDQFPFSELFRHILQIRDNGEISVAETTSQQMLRLLAFATCLIRLLGAAFSTLRLARYKEFVKQVGRTVRQTVQYVADTWSLYKSHRLSSGDTTSRLPPYCLDIGPTGQGRYSLNRLQLEFDQFVIRATGWILTAHRLGAWQFLADMPYSAISLKAIWNIFYRIYGNQMKSSDRSTSGEGSEGEREVSEAGVNEEGLTISMTANDIITALKDPTHKAQFTDMLMKTFTSEAVFLLTTFANMARARSSDNHEERMFISTIALEIFEVTQVTEFAMDVYSRTGSSLLDSIAIVHPFIISILIDRISEVIDQVGENCISVAKHLPLNIWTPTSTDLNHTHQWLVGTPLYSPPNKLARVLLGQLNWGRKTHDGSNDLVLDWWTHRSVALMIVEAHSFHLPRHPGGRDYISLQSSIAKYKSTLQRMTMSQEEKDFVSWGWEVILMLKLHPNQVVHNSMDVLTPHTQSVSESSSVAKDTSVYTQRGEPEWARLSPDSDEIVLPDLMSCGEREMAELRDAVGYEGTLASYVALNLTSLGSDTDHFLRSGLPLLHRLIDGGYFLPTLRVIANITPRFFKHKKILFETQGFLQAVIAVANADSTTLSLRDRITFVTPQPTLLRKMAGLLHTQLQSGRGQRGRVKGDVILQFWLHVFLSYPSWHREQSLLYLMNTLCLAVFSEPKWHKILINALLEGYLALGPLYVKGGLLSPVWSIVSSTSSPSIFASVSVKEFPWLSFFSLCAEQEFEENEGIWKQLLRQLKKDPKISVDNALKKAFVELKTPQGPFIVSSLSIYRWAEFCSSMEPGHPIVPLIWQKFFSLYLQRPILEDRMPERGSLGLRFFSQSRSNTQRRQMKSSLSAICMKLKSQIDRQQRGGTEREGEREGPVVEGERDYLLSTLSFFQTVTLWLEEPRLHDNSLYLPGLPQQYGSQRLATIFNPSEFQFWMEFVPLKEVKVQQLKLVEEWLQVESYQKMLASHTPKTMSDDAMTRIQKRIQKFKEPLAPPPLQLNHTPFEHLTEEILLSHDPLLVILHNDIQFVVQQANAYCTKYNTLATLDTQYMDGVSNLYSNEPRQFHVRVPCKTRLRSSHRCINPAAIVFRFEEMQINPKWKQLLEVNRSEYDQLLVSLSLPLPPGLCKAVLRMEHTVGELSRLSEELPDSERSKAIQSGINLFYEILNRLNLDCRLFPPSCQFLTSCIQILGQEFIQRDPSQTVRILDCLLKQPSKADLLAPLFHPNNDPTHFLEMYSSVETVAREEGPNVGFSVLTKFSVSKWLDDFPSSLSDRTTLLNYVWRGIIICGPDPSLEYEILLETYKHHLIIVVEYQFPELLYDFLHLLVEAIDQAKVAPSIMVTVETILTLSKEHPTNCRLGLQQCLDIATFFSQYYLRKRTIVMETLYTQLSWEHIPELGRLLYLICMTLACKWEESVAMGTSSQQEAIMKWWKVTVEMFTPWICSIPLPGNKESDQMHSPCLEPESGIMGTAMDYFVDAIDAAHVRLKDTTRQCSIMALLWNYYYTTLTLPSPSLPVLRVYHAHLINLPWNEYQPDLAAIEAMMKLKLTDYYHHSCFIFLGRIFPKIEWKTIVAGYCDISLHGNPEAPIQLHVMLLQLLIMLTAENDVMDKHETTIPEVMADAQNFHWQYIDNKTYTDILEWQKAHCDPGMVLETGSCLSLSLRLLKAAAGFPGNDITSGQELHPETWKKRCGYIEVIVHLITQASHKKQHQTGNYSDIVFFLFKTTLDVCFQVSESSDEGHVTYLIQTILSLLNTCSLSGGVRQKILDIIIHVLDEMPNAYFLSLPIISAGCHSIVDVSTLIKILEKTVLTHFGAIAMPTTKKQQLVLPHDPNGYGWHGVTSHLVLPQAKMDNLCRVCLAECAGVVLYAHLLKTLILSSSLQEEYKMAVKTIRWSVQLKPKSPEEEAEVFLIWEKAISLLLRQVQFGADPLELVPQFTAMATGLVRFGEDKASEGLLGVIGLGKKSTYSCQFRLISRTIATFLYCQMPVDTTQRTQLRTLPSSPGHIKDHNRPPPRSNTNNLPPNTIIPTKLADSSFHNLETLQTNKHYATYRERVVWCVEYVSNPVHCIMNTGELLVELCTEVYSQYRFLDLMRVLQK